MKERHSILAQMKIALTAVFAEYMALILVLWAQPVRNQAKAE
jgi:hypothetical protein